MGEKWSVVESEPTRKLVRGPVKNRETINTREGEIIAEPGDYIIQEEDGNCYPISADKLESYYRWIPGAKLPYEPKTEGD